MLTKIDLITLSDLIYVGLLSGFSRLNKEEKEWQKIRILHIDETKRFRAKEKIWSSINKGQLFEAFWSFLNLCY